MKPLAALYSTIDSAKRVLADRLANPVEDLKRTFGRAKEDTAKFRETQRAGGDKAMEAILELVLNGMPAAAAGKILFHGGPAAVKSVDPNLLRNGVQGTGFYTSNKLYTPHTFAVGASEYAPKGVGTISVYDLPDELYDRTLRVNDKPITKYTDVVDRLVQLFRKDDAVRQAVVDAAKLKSQSTGKSIEEMTTGKLIDSVLRKHYGGFDAASSKLSDVGIPGRTWQYSPDRPAELATLIYPGNYDKLEFIGATKAPGGIAGFKSAKLSIDNMLMDR